MTQILNLLTFVMELVFGRDASVRRTRSQTIRMMIIIAISAVCLSSDYYMFKSVYSSTAKYLAIKEQHRDYEELKARLQYLEMHNKLLESVIASISPNTIVAQPSMPAPPPTPPTTPIATPPVMVVPRDTPTTPIKTQAIDGPS